MQRASSTRTRLHSSAPDAPLPDARHPPPRSRLPSTGPSHPFEGGTGRPEESRSPLESPGPRLAHGPDEPLSPLLLQGRTDRLLSRGVQSAVLRMARRSHRGARRPAGESRGDVRGYREAVHEPGLSRLYLPGHRRRIPDRDHPGHRVALAPEEDGTGWRRGHSGCRSQPKITRTWWVDPSSTRSSSEPGTRVVPSMVKPTTPLVTPLGLLTWIS